MELVRKFLDISTANLPEETALAIDAESFPKKPAMVGEYGWLFSVPEFSEVYQVLEDQGVKCKIFVALMIYAAQNECDFILFDRDGLCLDGFPVFDW